MKKTPLLSIKLFAVILFPVLLWAQGQRPIPYPIFQSPQFEAAIANGTRTQNGLPGPNYWTNYTKYDISASLSPTTKMLRGEVKISYQNNSPDTLHQLVLKLYQNINKAGSPRNRSVNVTNGMQLTKVAIGGNTYLETGSNEKTGYYINGTLMYLRLSKPLLSGQSLELDIAWNFMVPPTPNARMGQDGKVFYLAYWYPQLAVYDDVFGWDEDPYLSAGEFYMGFADYNVNITVPEGWVIGATGVLQNPQSVLSPTVLDRLKRAAGSKEVITIVGATERKAGQSTQKSASSSLTWNFKAENVRDFAFGSSDQYIWDATSADAGDVDGDGKMDQSLIHAFYRPGTKSWNRAAEFGQFSVEYLSDLLWPYPWPHMTAVEGVINSGMEYPMMTLIGGERDEYSLLSVTIHEIAHMWFPMQVGQDEKSFTWMDEGLTRFNQNGGLFKFFPKRDPWAQNSVRIGRYYRIANTGNEVEIMRHGDRYPPHGSARGIASYGKPALGLRALQGIFGKEKFLEAYREYGRRWSYKHPQPYDLFNTFEDVLGQDLDWLWSSWFRETWTLDQAIASVDVRGSRFTVTIEDKGLVPMPVLLRLTYSDGRTEDRTIPVNEWLKGKRKTSVQIKGRGLKKVEIDPDAYLPDLDRSNNVLEVK